jgi:hypothetical protein
VRESGTGHGKSVVWWEGEVRESGTVHGKSVV